MSRSIKRSITIPQPVRDGLSSQIQNGILDYPSENAAWIGLARYQLLIGKPHPVTAAIARMHQHDQDVIDDFLLELSSRGLALRGMFLETLIHRVIGGDPAPTSQETAELIPRELLKLAMEWKKRPEETLARLEAQSSRPPAT